MCEILKTEAITAELNGPTLDWPAIGERDTVAQRLAAYLGNPFRSDIEFYIEADDVHIPAHSFIIGVGSPVLERIVYGTVDINGSKRIPVSNISQADFLEVLRYLYTDQANLTKDNVVPILMLTHYYDLKKLERQCEEMVRSSLNVKNVCSIFETVHLLENKITADCLDFITEKARDLVVNGKLMAMNLSALTTVLAQDKLNIDTEYQLYEAMHRYAVHECKNNGLLVTGENLREVLKGRLELIRFPTMNSEDFIKCVKLEADILSTNEIGAIIKSKATGDSGTLRYSMIPRVCSAKPVDLKDLQTCESFVRGSLRLRENDSSESQEIVSIKPVKLYGLILYQPGERVVISSKEQIIENAMSKYSNNSDLVLFQNPIIVTPETPFKIKLDYSSKLDWLDIAAVPQHSVLKLSGALPRLTRILYMYYQTDNEMLKP